MRTLLIFDFDGTLVDTLTDVALCFNEALRQCGLPAHPVAAYGGYVGGNLETVVGRLLPETERTMEQIDRVKSRYRALYAESPKKHTAPYAGILELLPKLRQQGYTLAVNSNKGQDLTEALVDRLFPEDTFSAVVAYKENRPSKPDPYGVNQIVKYCDMELNQAIYIGDGRSDVLTAKNAGIPCIFVQWGQGSSADYADYDACTVVRDVKDLAELLLNRQQDANGKE